MKALILLATVLMVCLVDVRSQEARKPEPNAEIVSKLEEIVAIRERQFKAHQEAERLGRAPVDSVAETNLVEARIRLAREKNETESVRNQLQKLIAVHKRRIERFERMPADRGSVVELDKARIDLLNAEIRLLRE